MNVGTKLLQAAAGNAGEAVYVDDVFSTNLWTGNDGTQSIVNGVDLSGEGGLVWIKNREQTYNHYLTDTERGATKQLSSNTDGSEVTSSVRITAFNNNGFTLGGNAATNGSTNGIVGWTFRKAEKFFDILTYTGDGTTSRTINHNLGSVPGMIIVKRTDASTNWSVYHRASPVSGSGKTYNLILQTYNAAGNSDFWPTTPTSTQFFLGDSDTAVNASGGTYVAYLFGHNEAEYGQNSDEAIIQCGSYEGNGNTVGPIVNLGFEPQWLLIKNIDDGQDGMHWYIFDNMRGMVTGGENVRLKANKTDADAGVGSSSIFDVSATGFQLNTTSGSYNANGNTFIYMAIARPNKPASEFAANKLFSMDGAGNASGDPDFVSNDHVVDWAFLKLLAGSEGAYATARPTGSTYISLSGVDKEYADSTLDKDFQ
jgi:hypothetical protein